MLNKKILATAVAVAFSTSALADIDLTANTTNDRVNVGTEALIAADFNGDGFVIMNNGAAANGASDEYLDIQSIVGFTIGQGTSKYIRVNLTGAEFGAAPALAVTGATVALSQGGDGQSFAIFEVAAPAGTDILSATPVILETLTYNVNPAGSSSVSISTYDDAADAVNQTGVLYSDSKAFTNVASVVTGDITNAAVSVATVGSNFKAFTTASGSAFSTTVGKVGELDTADYLTPGSVDNDGVAIQLTSLINQNQAVAVEGDFSFGTWVLRDNLDCDPTGATDVALSINTAKTVATSAVTDVTTAPLAVCVTVPAVAANTPAIKKGSYSLEILEDELEGALGSIQYNTVSVDVPYITTFAAYNQRLYIVNNGNQDALYTMSFTSEDGTTATPAAGATGIVPAGEMVALKATDVVTLSGATTRTSAVIEIEAEDADITAASQSVNLETGGTDTVVLN